MRRRPKIRYYKKLTKGDRRFMWFIVWSFFALGLAALILEGSAEWMLKFWAIGGMMLLFVFLFKKAGIY